MFNLKEFASKHKASVCAGVTAASSAIFSPLCFADTFAVTGEMIEPITTGITTSVTNMLPSCLSVLAIMVGVSLIPKFIWKFL